MPTVIHVSPIETRSIFVFAHCTLHCISAQPIHWVDDDDVMSKAVEENGGNPEFVSSSVNPYYTLPTGSQSPYGDELVVMLESLVACRGTYYQANLSSSWKLKKNINLITLSNSITVLLSMEYQVHVL